ncbi:gluconate 2-dehydrogenase subunit 3 family protein [Virgibacillus sp. CBA3643]|uniref:gluconate 2-dehydrogenase subunit 3 family protein n=1 Tax=Virgibacillus sp. CBA3643 TaxID=2942278 RepID=UPI0035A309C4
MTDNNNNEPDDTANSTSQNHANQNHDPSRRRFIKNTGMVVGGLAGGSLLGGMLTNQFQTEPTTAPVDEKEQKIFMEARMFFTRYEEFVVLEQATERIFPKNDNGPGAIELGVPYFIDKQLAGPWGMNGKDYRQGPFTESDPSTDLSRLNRGEIFISGLRKMNQLSHKQFDSSFDEAEEDQQIKILQDFEDGKVDMKGVD